MRFPAFLLLLAAMLFVVGCGGSDDSGSDDAGSSSSTETSTTDSGSGTSEATGQVVEVGVVPSELKFDPSTLSASAGTVTFKFTNSNSIGHNFGIKQGDKVLGQTDIISNDSAELTVDLEPGEYTFFCAPHESAGMTGTLTVA